MLRKLTAKEEQLIEFLINHSSASFPSTWKDTIRVEPMNDGGMGSLTLYPNGSKDPVKRAFGSVASNAEFKDKDGVYVLAGLFLDQNGHLFELDMFKGDFSPLIEIPDISEITSVELDSKGNGVATYDNHK